MTPISCWKATTTKCTVSTVLISQSQQSIVIRTPRIQLRGPKSRSLWVTQSIEQASTARQVISDPGMEAELLGWLCHFAWKVDSGMISWWREAPRAYQTIWARGASIRLSHDSNFFVGNASSISSLDQTHLSGTCCTLTSGNWHSPSLWGLAMSWMSAHLLETAIRRSLEVGFQDRFTDQVLNQLKPAWNQNVLGRRQTGWISASHRKCGWLNASAMGGHIDLFWEKW